VVILVLGGNALEKLDLQIPQPVLELLHHSICSVEQLESLLLMRRNSHCGYSAEQLASKLRTSVMSAGQTLTTLSGHGLLEDCGDGTYRYASAPDVDQIVEQLAGIYKVRRFSVIQAIYNTP
jgi:DNA-binding transcriptional ArsR family regulator